MPDETPPIPGRTPGLRGRLPASFPAAIRDLTYYAAGPLPAPPPTVAVPEVANWNVDGNDRYGDCGVASLNHVLMAAATDTSQHEKFPTAAQVVKYYLTYTGGQDDGVVLADFLAYVRKTGFYGHQIAAYAPVAVHDVPTVQFCVNAYDACYTGIVVTQAMEDAFSAGKPWTSATNKGQVLGGHAVPIVGYDDQFLTVVTWGQLQKVAWPAWHKMSEEAWCLIPGELVKAGDDGHGINLAALQADLSKLDA